MSRLPIRLRLTLPFALAMALVLAAMGVVIYLRVGERAALVVDQNLGAQAPRRCSRAEEGRELARPATSATARRSPRCVAARRHDRRLVAVDGLPPLLSTRRLERVLAGRRAVDAVTIPGLRGEWRLRASPVQRRRRAARRSSSAARSQPRDGDAAPSRARVPRSRRLRRCCSRSSPATAWPRRRCGPSRRCAAARRRSAPRRPGAACPFRRRATRSRRSRTRSTRCSAGSRRRSSTNGASSPTRATSCARRSRCCAPSSSSRCAGRARARSSRPRCARPPRRPSG